jgi:hypothetical protein
MGANVLARLERGESRTFAWCVAPADPARDAVWVARDDGRVLRWEPQVERVGSSANGPGGEGGVIELVRTPGLVLPAGVYSFPFARDLDGDGRTDLALPEPSGLRLFFAGEDGAPRKGPLVRHDVEAEVELPAPEEIEPEASASLRVPAFQCEDQNGDGQPDLAFIAEDRIQFFWSNERGELPETPTLDLDLEELRRGLDASGGSLLDPSNLFKALERQVTADVCDLDGDGLADLLLRQGPKVSIHAGTRGGIDRARAAQVLKTSGNLIAAFPADDSGDGRLDLCMLQAADVSIGEVLLWVVVGGSLELDLYTYFQEPEKLRFAKSPSRRRRLEIDVPAILGIGDEIEKNASIARLAEELARLPVALDLDGDGTRDDVALFTRDGVVELYEGASPAEPQLEEGAVWRSVIERFDREVQGKDEVTIPLLGVLDWVPVPGGRLRAAIAGRAPSATIGSPDPAASREPPPPGHPAAEAPATRRILVVLDFDGDRRDDLLVVEPEADGGSTRIDVYRAP